MSGEFCVALQRSRRWSRGEIASQASAVKLGLELLAEVEPCIEAVLEERESAAKWPSVLAQRNALIEKGILKNQDGAYIFTKDVEFSSPSSAAATIHGGSANGLTAWINSDGKQLKQLQNV